MSSANIEASFKLKDDKIPDWARQYVTRNPGFDAAAVKATHRCTLCDHPYQATTTRISNHIVGDTKDVMSCKPSGMATEADRSFCRGKRVKTPKTSVVMPLSESTGPTHDESVEENLATETVAPGASSSAGGSSGGVSTALAVRPAPAKLSDGDVGSLLSHMNTKLATNEVDKAWSRAFAAVKIAPHVADNFHWKAAVKMTSELKAAYDGPSGYRIGGSLLKKVEIETNKILKDLKNKEKDGAATLTTDGWDKSTKEVLVNFLSSNFYGDEFLGDEDLTGKDKGGDAMSKLILKWMKIAEERGGRRPSGVCTDNPTVMRSARAKVEAEDPNVITYSCIIHGISKLMEDIGKLPAIKVCIEKHTLIVRKVRAKQFLHDQLKKAQECDELKPRFTKVVDTKVFILIYVLFK